VAEGRRGKKQKKNCYIFQNFGLSKNFLDEEFSFKNAKFDAIKSPLWKNFKAKIKLEHFIGNLHLPVEILS